MIAIYIRTKNDTNGNPRRGWLIVNTTDGENVDFVDEGYSGHGALAQAGYLAAGSRTYRAYPDHKEIVIGPGLDVTPAQYRDLKKEFQQVTPEQHQVVADKANDAMRGSRRTVPYLCATSSRGTLIEWLSIVDPNGVHTDEQTAAEDFDPHTVETAWEHIAQIVTY